MRTMFRVLVFVSFLVCHFHFSHAQTARPQIQPEVDAQGRLMALWESRRPDGLNWTQFLQNEIQTSGLDLVEVIPRDVQQFCPKYPQFSQLQRRDFWIYFLSVISFFESTFRPEVYYRESFANSRGKRVVSRGLLQISIESSSYYGCGFRTEQQLHDPRLNLACGLKILRRWVTEDQLIAAQARTGGHKGAGRYWSLFRRPFRKFNRGLVQVRAAPTCH